MRIAEDRCSDAARNGTRQGMECGRGWNAAEDGIQQRMEYSRE